MSRIRTKRIVTSYRRVLSESYWAVRNDEDCWLCRNPDRESGHYWSCQRHARSQYMTRNRAEMDASDGRIVRIRVYVLKPVYRRISREQ